MQNSFFDAVLIVNDRPLTTLSDQPGGLLPITPSSFLEQELASNKTAGEFHDKATYERILSIMLIWHTGSG